VGLNLGSPAQAADINAGGELFVSLHAGSESVGYIPGILEGIFIGGRWKISRGTNIECSFFQGLIVGKRA